jgi:hypothetical protein
MGIYRIYTIFNGMGDQYRLMMVNNDTNSNYNELLYLDGCPTLDTMYKVSGYNIPNVTPTIIDLSGYTQSGLSAIKIISYPNPADNMIYLTAYLPQSTLFGDHKNTLIRIRIFSVIGIEIYSGEITPGQTIAIPSSDFPVGAYYIRVEDEAEHNTAAPAYQNLMINR